MSLSPRLTIAIQKKGRLNEESLLLLQRCGLKLVASKTSLFYSAQNYPLDVLLVRDDDIPGLINDKICDFGIVGKNVLQEVEQYNEVIDVVQALPFGKCRLSIAVPKEFTFKHLNDLSGKRIATSYPTLLKTVLCQNKIDAQIVSITGSVEIAPRLKMAEAICDLVSTGRTLEENNLKEVMMVLESQAVLIRNKCPTSEYKQCLADKLMIRIMGVLQAQESKYIMFHAPKASINKIKAMLPGTQWPTIMPLYGNEDLVAVHVVSKENVFWEFLEQLKEQGATSILVLPLEKMMG